MAREKAAPKSEDDLRNIYNGQTFMPSSSVTNFRKPFRIEGYASVFGIPDQAGDIVMPGAFRRCLAEKGARGIKFLYQHDAREPIGVWKVIREDDTGLRVRGLLSREASKARDVGALVRDGAIDGLSIGFRTVKARRDRASGRRLLLQVDLLEISIVTFPLNDRARLQPGTTFTKSRAVSAGTPGCDARLAELRWRAVQLTPS